MVNQKLLEIIADFNFWQKKQDTGIPRKELTEVFKFADDKNYALIVAGIRRSGKTFLCRQILQEKINQGIKPEQTLYVNFEDPALGPFLNTNFLQDFYDTYRYNLNKENFTYIVFDEIHNVPNWEKWIRIMIDKKIKAKFILTGSSSKFYKGKQAEILTGRGFTFFLFPLQFTDFLKFKNYSLKKVESYQSISPLLSEYLEFGGFPLIVLEPDQTKKQIYLKELFDDIITKDLIVKRKLRESDIRQLAVVLINQFSALVSVRRSQTFMADLNLTKISPMTINSYLSYFASSFLFLFVPIFSYKAKEIMRYPKKIYCVDTGLINSLGIRFSDNIGRLYENIAAKFIWERYDKDNLFYWKNQTKEVDFILKQGQKVSQLIQVCFNLKTLKAKEREILALLKASDELKCDNLLVITSDYEAEEKHKSKTIKFIPLWKWLLGKV
ncbi:MAG: hypothetical protein ACD_12C00727G0001 [uncultured bacterium]|nr:MAG: hypothetical protein ACD_12C00727G0001 [uncultured bacterium]